MSEHREFMPIDCRETQYFEDDDLGNYLIFILEDVLEKTGYPQTNETYDYEVHPFHKLIQVDRQTIVALFMKIERSSLTDSSKPPNSVIFSFSEPEDKPCLIETVVPINGVMEVLSYSLEDFPNSLKEFAEYANDIAAQTN